MFKFKENITYEIIHQNQLTQKRPILIGKYDKIRI